MGRIEIVKRGHFKPQTKWNFSATIMLCTNCCRLPNAQTAHWVLFNNSMKCPCLLLLTVGILPGNFVAAVLCYLGSSLLQNLLLSCNSEGLLIHDSQKPEETNSRVILASLAQQSEYDWGGGSCFRFVRVAAGA